MSKKAKILVSTYLAALILALGAYSAASRSSLADYRLAAKYSASQAFEETVSATAALSTALEKSVYATDGSMCSSICGEAYAKALAAETALSTLPFSTQELEQVAAFLNVAGDYAYTLCAEAASRGFTEEQLRALTDMSRTAAEFADYLRLVQSGVNSGDVIMDSREARLQNVGEDSEAEKLSARLLQYEAGFEAVAQVQYNGKYSPRREKSSELHLTEEDMLSLAADYAGVDKSQLKKEYDYSGTDNRHCYSAGDVMVCVSAGGVESMSRSRLVSEANISGEQAEQLAADFLKKHGYEGLEPVSRKENGGVCRMSFAKTEDGAVFPDDVLTISIALDDGSVYAFNAVSYDGSRAGCTWNISQEDAKTALPDSLTLQGSRKVVLRSAGGNLEPCYELDCADKNGRQVKIYVNAETGLQSRIELGEKPDAEKL